MDRTLPNGTILRNVDPNITDDDLKQQVIQLGYATAEDYDVDTKTKADMLSTVGEIGGGVAGAMYGASIGAAAGPLGAAIGGILGGAAGTFGGSIIGQGAEAIAEDRSLAPATEVAGEAVDAAITDAAFGVGFGIVGKALGTIAKPIYNLVRSSPVLDSVENITAKAALEIKTGGLSVQEAAAKYNLTPDMLDTFKEQLAKSEDELLKIDALQEKLLARGATLLPSQTGVAGTSDLAAQEISAASLTMSKVVDDVILAQNDYILKEFGSLLDATATLTREETGAALKNLADDTALALKVEANKLYKEIDKAGGILIRPASVGLELNRIRKTMTPVPSSIAALDKIFKSIPSTSQPKDIEKGIGRLVSFKNTLTGPQNATARAYADKAIKGLRKKMTGPNFVNTAPLQKLGLETLDNLINKYGRSSIEGKFATRAKKLTQMRGKMSFSEAHDELSNLKKLQRDMDADLGGKDSQANALLIRAITTLEGQMGAAAKRFNPKLKADYDAAGKLYADGIKVINGDWIVRSLNKKNPATIGEDLVNAGEQIGVDSVRALMAKAKELGVNNQGVNILESVKANYLTSLFPTRSAREAENFAKNMMQPKFRDTFAAIVDKGTAKKLSQLAEEVGIMQKGLAGAESAASLTVRGRELGAATSPSIQKAATYFVVSNAVTKKLQPENVNKIINTAKAINATLAKGGEVSPNLVDKFIENSFLAPYQAGQVAGALLTN